MSPFPASRFSYRSRNKSPKKSTRNYGWVAAAVLFTAAFAFYAVLFPEMSGLWGRRVAQFLGWLAGTGRYFVPLLIGYVAVQFFIRGGKGVLALKIIFLSLL